MEATIYSLIPPLLALLLVILTRRVLLSLGIGIIVGAWLLKDLSVTGAISQVFESFRIIFGSVNEETNAWELNTWNVYIIIFLLLLGIITALVSITGGSRAFGEWALKRVKTRAGAHIVTTLLGLFIFIDDYFNSLAVGQVSRPLTDRHKISRAKLAYLIDSTSAPICVVSPVSSWGAYIIGLLVPILAAQGITEYGALSAFIQMIPMNLYVIIAIGLVFAVSVYNINIGQMKKHEQLAIEHNQLTDPRKVVPGELKNSLPVSNKGTVGDLIIPIISLIVGTVGSMIVTGILATDGAITAITIFENTDVTGSLVYGGLIGVIVTLVTVIKQRIAPNILGRGIFEGIRSMLSAIIILIFAWMIVDIIGRLQTGEFLAQLVKDINMDVAYLPLIIFILAGIMAFATGTSWGTFGIMLPIAGDIAGATDISLLLPALAAVLAGSVFGDHCSPISDTTILSSTGAGSNHIDHVITQLPYAIIAAVISAIGYLVLGLAGSVLLSIGISLLLLVGIVLVLKINRA
ncbi:Na+/H+ antiporter NhaC family protein [Radiobacillus sp. PE A8.2]|uniref:Na+/H+ antiporter NhaC family protein n=1 Tax=Radiobacillus sp. PE A8.2 TaxID=3380349 RepID=UPI00388F6F90